MICAIVEIYTYIEKKCSKLTYINNICYKYIKIAKKTLVNANVEHITVCGQQSQRVKIVTNEF